MLSFIISSQTKILVIEDLLTEVFTPKEVVRYGLRLAVDVVAANNIGKRK